MVLIPCSECGREISDQAPACIHCGYPLKFKVVLKAFGPRKIDVIKTVRQVTGLGLKEARDLVEAAPSNVCPNVSRIEAERILRELSRAGAVAQIQVR